MATSLPRAADLGILANGTDQTAALNMIFSNSAYAGVIIDFSPPAAVTISGTLNCQGKQLIFTPGSYITGAGTISNCVINAGYRQKCFDITSSIVFISLTNCSTNTSKFSVQWYGAPVGSADTLNAIQKSLDMVVANPLIKTVFIPEGSYIINNPLLIYSWNGTNYAQVCIRMEGETSFWQSSTGGSTITCNGFKNTFALGIQLGKGVEVKHLKFVGGFTPPFTGGSNFYNCTFAAFTDGVSRDTANSPYSGIVVDPFYSVVPSDGGYPGLTSFYRGSGIGGSTGTIIEDVIITNFVCGFITSPNGQTANAELINITKIQFANCKACIVGCQAQEKLNVVNFAACWSGTHTFFYQGIYGAGTPGNWSLNGVNIAGALNTFINRNGGGYFPMYVRNVYAESLGTIGTWTSSQGDTLQDSIFDFVDLVTYPEYPTNTHLSSIGVTIKNCSFRYYGAFLPMVFNGGLFEDCVFDQLPYGTTDMRNCYCSNGGISPQTDILGVYRMSSCRSLAGGRGKFVDQGEYLQGKQISLNFKDYIPAGFLQLDGLTGSTSTFTVSSNVATVTPPTTADLGRVIIGRVAINISTGAFLGIVTAVGASTYTISYVPKSIVSGNYVIYIWCPAVNFSFMGTCTAGSPTITNVVIDFGNYSELVSYGGGFVKIPNFYGFRSYTQGAKILAYNSVAGTITMDRPAYASSTNYYFANNGAVKEINVLSINDNTYLSGSGLKDNEIFPKGSEFITDAPHVSSGGRQIFMITQTGYYNSPPQATWIELT